MEEPAKPPKQKLDTGLVVALIAILINVITVSVYIYQSNIMRKQQHAAVWPHLEWNYSYIDSEGFELVIKNNGIGPALVKSTKMSLDNELIENMDSLCTKLVGTTRFPHLIGNVENRVIPPGEKIVLIKSDNQAWSEKLFYTLLDRDFNYQVCYASIYEEQWTCHGKTVIKGPCN